MPFLPVAHRELAVAARKKATTWSRVATAGIALVFALVLIATARPPLSRLGPRLLDFLTLLLFIESLLAGVRYTCDCLSEEKRDGTLGLLFLTNLSGFDVVAGKIAGRAMPAFYNLLAVIPIFGLSILFGGVTGRELIGVSAVLLANTLFSLAVGMFISSRGYSEKSVLVKTLVVLMIVCFLPPILWYLVNFWTRSGYLNCLLLLSPAFAFREAGRGALNTVWWSTGILAVTSILMLASAAFHTRRSLSVLEPRGSLPPKARQIPFPWPHRWLLDVNPFQWLASRHQSRLLQLYFPALVLAFALFCRLTLQGAGSINNFIINAIFFGSYGMHCLLKFLWVAENTRLIQETKRSGALELLLTTPLEPHQIIAGQLTAARQLAAPAVISVIVLNLAWMTLDDFLKHLLLVIPCSIALVFIDLAALRWQAILHALRGKRYPATVMRTFFQTMAPPLIVLLLIFFVTSAGGLTNEAAQAIIVFWTVGCALFNLCLTTSARIALANFRSLASGQKLTSDRPVHFTEPSARDVNPASLTALGRVQPPVG